MSLDFFRSKCQEAPRTNNMFGLCDDQDGKIAYTDVVNPDKWIATVNNANHREVVFTAIDKCVLLDVEFKGRGRCDGMLTTVDSLYLVELKDKEPPWLEIAIAQLESTIQFLDENHDLSAYKKRKAYACNKKRDRFVVFDNETNARFFKKTTFRLDAQAEILIF